MDVECPVIVNETDNSICLPIFHHRYIEMVKLYVKIFRQQYIRLTLSMYKPYLQACVTRR